MRQVVPVPTISWAPDWKPYTIIGDSAWTDYEVSVDVYLNPGDEAGVMGRINDVGSGYGFIPKGYYLPYEHKVRGKKSLYYELTNYENLRKRLSVDNIIYLILHQPEQAILMSNDHIMIGNTRNTVLPWERIDRQSSDPHKRESRQNSAGSLFSGLIRKKGE